MPGPTSRVAVGRGRLSRIVILVATLSGDEAFAQATGDVSVPPKGPPGLEALAKRMAESPETRLDLYVTPQFTHEKYDGYQEEGTFQDPILGEATIISPEFTVTTTEIGVAADHLFPNGLFLGGGFAYSNADYDFDHGSLAQAFAEATELGALGEPLDRSYDQYGVTFTTGYLKDPWALLFTGRYARRDNIETLRREPELDLANSRTLVIDARGNTTSDVYSVGMSVNYRLRFDSGAALIGLGSILYQREATDNYTEEVESAFAQPLGANTITQISELRTNQVRKFDDQTIESIPLEIGALFSAPIGGLLHATYNDGAGSKVLSLVNLNVGATYTHDFDNQRRTINGESLLNPEDSVKYKEKNRNQDFFSFLGALDFNLLNLIGTLSYQGDLGFDEREYAHIVTLQLRMPLSF